MDSILSIEPEETIERPWSVWIAQELVIGLTLLTILGYWFVLFGFGGLDFGVKGRDLKITIFIFDVAFVVIGLFAYVASKKVLSYARVLLAALLLSVNISFILDFGADPPDLAGFTIGEIALLLAIFTPIVALPFIVLPLILLFNRKVKMFFDPSLIPHESLSVFNEPPPPPSFDEQP